MALAPETSDKEFHVYGGTMNELIHGVARAEKIKRYESPGEKPHQSDVVKKLKSRVKARIIK